MHPLKESNSHQLVRSQSFYPLNYGTITSIESFGYVSNFYILLLLQSYHSHVYLLRMMMDDNHNTNFHFVCYIWNNNNKFDSFVLLFLLSFYIRFVYLMLVKCLFHSFTFNWHVLKDSNLYLRFWRPLCYHCTKDINNTNIDRVVGILHY